MRRWGLALLVPALAFVAGCDTGGEEPNLSLERMIDQPRYDAYEATTLFEDGKAMRAPPAGTIPRERLLGPPELVSGLSTAGEPVAELPVLIDRARLERGRDRYRIYCGVCHGLAGDGDSPVAENMTLRKPPSLVEEPIRGRPPGHVFRVATSGYGLMPSYADVLTVEDRWAVVAYVEVLQLAAEVELEALPPELRRDARRWLEEEAP